MSAVNKLTPEELAEAPRIWRRVGSGMNARVIDPEWMEARRQRLAVEQEARIHAAKAKAEQERVAAIVQKAAEDRALTGRDILQAVAVARGIPVAEIISRSRKKLIAQARQQAAYEIRRRTSLSLPQIAVILGCRDHTTILHAVRVWPQKAAKLGIPVDLEPEA